jgi:predicted nucleic acid-binding Zn ribbon protein
MSKDKPAHILRHFAYDHLPPHLREVAEAFNILATAMDARLPECAEKSAGLRKLLEAKDCFVRARLEE